MSFDIHYGVDGTPFYVAGRPEPVREPLPPSWKGPFDLPRMGIEIQHTKESREIFNVFADRYERRLRKLRRRLGARRFKRYIARGAQWKHS